jgi:hypothetical protein
MSLEFESEERVASAVRGYGPGVTRLTIWVAGLACVQVAGCLISPRDYPLDEGGVGGRSSESSHEDATSGRLGLAGEGPSTAGDDTGGMLSNLGGASARGGSISANGGNDGGGENPGTDAGGSAGRGGYTGGGVASGGNGGTPPGGGVGGTSSNGGDGSSGGICNGIANWTSKSYVVGDYVVSKCSGPFVNGCPSGESHKFECNPANGVVGVVWCQQREPGVGNGWAEAWVDKGKCP